MLRCTWDMASHFYLDDFPQSSEPLSDQPLPHTHVNPAEAFEAEVDEGYRGQPFPQPPREMLRQRSFFSDSSSDFGAADPAQALRMDGFDAPQPPSLSARLRESGPGAAAGRGCVAADHRQTERGGAAAGAGGTEGGGGGGPCHSRHGSFHARAGGGGRS